MANAERGEVSFEATGKTWTLRYTTNALAELEDHLGKNTGEIVSALQSSKGVSVKMLRAILWGGLLDGQPQTKVQDTGVLIDAIGFGKASELIGKAFTLAFPPAEDSDARPPNEGKDGPSA